MILKLETERLSTLEEVRQFIVGSAAVDFAGVDRESTYEFTRRTLVRFDYGRLGRADKGTAAALPDEGDGAVAGAGDAAHRAAGGHRADRGPPRRGAVEALRAGLHGGGRPAFWRRRTSCSGSCRAPPRGR